MYTAVDNHDTILLAYERLTTMEGGARSTRASGE